MSRGDTDKAVRSFLAGGLAGATARTVTAPLDRIKILFQVQAVASSGTSATAYTGVGQAFMKIYREEGITAFWKGNGVNIIRIFPHAAAQMSANDYYKRVFAGHAFCCTPSGDLTTTARLAAGAAAGMTATAMSHPLDTIRLRLALPNSHYKGMVDAAVQIVRHEGPFVLYKGVMPALVGIAPYAALNFALYDLAKVHIYAGKGRSESALLNLSVGAATGLAAATACYPLDTIRRRMQMKGNTYSSQLDAFRSIFMKEGLAGFYRGWAANALKVMPQNSVRFVSYELFKKLLGIQKARTDT